MTRRIVWVHGIGRHDAGYSREWRDAFNPSLNLSDDSYFEVVWDTVFRTPRAQGGVLGAAGTNVTLTPEEEAAQHQVEEELALLLQARQASSQQQPANTGVLGGGASSGVSNEIIEWSKPIPSAGGGVLGSPIAGVSTLGFLREYVGDFAKYLVSRNVRNAVKNKFKQQLAQITARGDRVSVVSHSWGTVVAYDSLIDLQAESGRLPVVNLFTLGSPLWMVRRFLEDSTGQKPAQVGLWTNVFAKGDMVGSWLHSGFQVDKEFQVPSLGNDAHGSYFVPRNDQVQKNIIAKFVLTD